MTDDPSTFDVELERVEIRERLLDRMRKLFDDPEDRMWPSPNFSDDEREQYLQDFYDWLTIDEIEELNETPDWEIGHFEHLVGLLLDCHPDHEEVVYDWTPSDIQRVDRESNRVPRLRRKIHKLQAENAELRREIADLRASSAGA